MNDHDMGIVQWILDIAHRNPQLAAGVVGVILSMAATQYFKYLIPNTWSHDAYRSAVRLIGFFTGWAFGYGAWRIFDPSDGEFADIYWASGIGFLGPLIYSIIVPVIVKRWPYLDKVLSGRPSVTP